jgi:hypothetical protein
MKGQEPPDMLEAPALTPTARLVVGARGSSRSAREPPTRVEEPPANACRRGTGGPSDGERIPMLYRAVGRGGTRGHAPRSATASGRPGAAPPARPSGAKSRDVVYDDHHINLWS